jgi:hypothetical protein
MNRVVLALILAVLLTVSVSAQENTFTVNSYKDLPAANPGDGTALTVVGSVTVRSALQEANIQPGHQVIDIAYELPSPIEVRSTLRVEDDLTLIQTAAVVTSLRSYGEVPFRFLEVMEGVRFTLKNIGIQRGELNVAMQADRGAIIYVNPDAVVELMGGTMHDGVAMLEGGAIYVDRATLIVRSFTISARSEGNGGGIYNNQGTVIIGTITGAGRAGINGGLLYNHGGIVTIGGLERGSISGGTAEGDGGVLYSDGGLVKVHQARIRNGSAAHGGGVFLTGNAEMRMDRVSMYDNVASEDGGGVHIDSGILEASQVTFADNVTEGLGGGIFLGAGGAATLINCTVTANDAGQGGGLHIAEGGNVALGNTICADNGAQQNSVLDISGHIRSFGRNLIGVADGATGVIAADYRGTAVAPLNPVLRYFGRYPDDPFLQRSLNVYVPDVNSPVIDAGDNTLLSHPDYVGSRCLDPGNLPRVRNETVDIGAIELQQGTEALPCGGHSADREDTGRIGLEDLLRVIQFFNADGYHCDPDGEDGYAPGLDSIAQDCAPHASDYNPQDWRINLSELLRLIQFFNSGGYYPCPDNGSEDSFCPGAG